MFSSERLQWCLVIEFVDIIFYQQHVHAAHLFDAMQRASFLRYIVAGEAALDHQIMRMSLGVDVIGALAVLNRAAECDRVFLGNRPGQRDHQRNAKQSLYTIHLLIPSPNSTTEL